MQNFIIALAVKMEFLTEEEGKKMAAALFGRPIPDEYEACKAFLERLLSEAKLSSTRKYFDPIILEKNLQSDISKKPKKSIANKK